MFSLCRISRGYSIVVLALLFSLAHAAIASSLITVTNAGDTHVDGKLTLREAVAASNSGDIITFAFNILGTINLTRGQITIDHDLSIFGGAPYLQTIRQEVREAPNRRIFSITQGTVFLSNLHLIGGVVAAADATATVPVHAAQGAGVKNLGDLTVSDCEFSGCTCLGGTGLSDGVNREGGAAQGGAIFNGGTLTVVRSAFQEDRALGGRGGAATSSATAGLGGTGAGGAIYNTGIASVTNCTFLGLAADGGSGGGSSTFATVGTGGLGTGGAIFNAGTLTLINATLFQNTALAGEGGVVGTIFPSTNRGIAQGGGLAVATAGIGHTFVRNTIIAGNVSGRGRLDIQPDQPGQDVFSSVNSNGYNLIGLAGDSSGWLTTDQLGTTAPIDPKLRMHHNNGGATFTLALKPDSPAIDRGAFSALGTDQRGLSRTFDDPAVANSAGGDGTDVGAFELQPAPASNVINISTRAQVLTGDQILIGGTIIAGNVPKKIIFRVLGADSGVNTGDVLFDPTLELRDENGALIAFNDNWQDTQQSEIEDVDLIPGTDADAAIVKILLPGRYTAIVRGKADTTGVALLEMYDLNYPDPTLTNVSSRSLVGTGDNAAIAGIILGSGGGGSTKIIARALGPSLSNSSVTGLLEDTILDLYDEDGTLLATNDNWKDTQRAAIEATGIPPTDDRESAIVATLDPGNYTTVVRGKNDSTGVGIVEIYKLP